MVFEEEHEAMNIKEIVAVLMVLGGIWLLSLGKTILGIVVLIIGLIWTIDNLLKRHKRIRPARRKFD